MSILNKYKRAKNLLILIKDLYYDFVLSQDDVRSEESGNILTNNGLIGYIDFTNSDCFVKNGEFVSLPYYTWDDAINEGVDLRDIGLTGIDNGTIKFPTSAITDDEFINILTNSNISYSSGDTRFHVYNVGTNITNTSYEYLYHPNEYISLNGGFLQGSFKIEGFNYQIFPTIISDAMHFELVLRPTNATTSNTLNDEYPNNKGIFFYIGTRAENKFTEILGGKLDEYPDRVNFTGETISGETVYNEIVDSNGDPLSVNIEDDIKTDNKYLLFHHGKEGFTVDTWDENVDVSYRVNKAEYSEGNLFLKMHHAPSGYTVDTIDRLVGEENSTKSLYSIKKDLYHNAFALKLNDDGSIGYRYLVKDCDSETGFSIKEEKTFPNIITANEWSTINLKFEKLDGLVDECGRQYEGGKMKVYIYVNGYLKLVSQELPLLDLKSFDDSYTKQELVTYTISIGGGTQGLHDCIYPNKDSRFNKILPLEENFSGSFIGDIRSFKMYNGSLAYNEVKNNSLYEQAMGG